MSSAKRLNQLRILTVIIPTNLVTSSTQVPICAWDPSPRILAIRLAAEDRREIHGGIFASIYKLLVQQQKKCSSRGVF